MCGGSMGKRDFRAATVPCGLQSSACGGFRTCEGCQDQQSGNGAGIKEAESEDKLESPTTSASVSHSEVLPTLMDVPSLLPPKACVYSFFVQVYPRV